MHVVEIRCRFIQCEGKHSFQIYNGTTGVVIWCPPDWWNTKKEAESACTITRNNFLEDLRAMGYPISAAPGGGELVGMPQGPGQQMLAAVLAVHKQTGKYGFAVMKPDGEIIIVPKRYYDTPMEAFRAANDSYHYVSAELNKLGLGMFQYAKPDIKDFQPEDAMLHKVTLKPIEETPSDAPKQKSPQKYPFFKPLQGFDPSVN